MATQLEIDLAKALKKMIALWDACGGMMAADEAGDFITNNFEAADEPRAVLNRYEHLNRR